MSSHQSIIGISLPLTPFLYHRLCSFTSYSAITIAPFLRSTSLLLLLQLLFCCNPPLLRLPSSSYVKIVKPADAIATTNNCSDFHPVTVVSGLNLTEFRDCISKPVTKAHRCCFGNQVSLFDLNNPETVLDVDANSYSLNKVMLHTVSIHKHCFSYPKSNWQSQNPSNLKRVRLRVSATLHESNGVKLEYTPWLIVGLGNPGNKYHGTRHNVGFEMVDRISQDERIVMNTIQSKALIGIGSIGEVPVLLAKPQGYMNFSGESVGPLAAYYQVPLRHILLVYDEMSLPNGVLRLQPKGGHGYHNGVKSVIEHLDGCREFPRFCIGIGNPPGTMDMKAFLLQKFSDVERKEIDAALEQGVGAVRSLVLNGFNDRITRFNLGQKYKYNKV